MGPQSAADGTALASLADSVRDYTDLLRTIDSAGLERPWGWGPYDGEGVRFSVFRTFEELRELAVALAAARVAAGRPSTEASLFLAGHHLAQRDLWAMLGSPPEVALHGGDRRQSGRLRLKARDRRRRNVERRNIGARGRPYNGRTCTS